MRVALNCIGTAVPVEEEIRKENPWYTGAQFEWAQRPPIRRIYDKRYQFISACLERAKAGSRGPLRALDAGCGDGYWLWRLGALEGIEWTGVDYNPLRIERARIAAPSARLVVGDLNSFVAGETFDVVLLNQVVEHVPDDVGLFRKVRSLTRPDGTLILGAPNEGSRLQQWMLKRTGTRKTTDHVHFYTEGELRQKILDAGWIIDRVYREVFYPGFDRLYYGLTRRGWGFCLLELLTRLWPAECSDYYFECRPKAGAL